MPITQPDAALRALGPSEQSTEGAGEPVLNVAGYLFVELRELDDLRLRLLSAAQRYNLRGTVLLSSEGINAFMAGTEEGVRGWLDVLRTEDGLATFRVKESWSTDVPFRRLKVKIKREIIRMDHPTIKPAYQRAESVAPFVLKAWLDRGSDDDGRPVVMLDTRNDFEVDCGTFVGAIHWNIAKFTEFPSQVVAHAADLAGKRVVSFCTGGIRCEKAALFMRDAGIEHVVQLDGGILQYFEDVGQQHFDGACFVFDERVGLRGDLTPMRA